MKSSEQIGELAKALAAAQAAMKNPHFDSVNPFFNSRYASLAAVRDAVIPPLTASGISCVQLLGVSEGYVTCETVLMHNSGQWVSGTVLMPVVKQDGHGYGSASTYARRYGLMAICMVVGDEDDDANAATNKKPGVFPNAGAGEPLTAEQKTKVENAAKAIIATFASKTANEILLYIDEQEFNNDEKLYLWTFLDSKQRAAIKKASAERRAA